jgi:hypothetical protein
LKEQQHLSKKEKQILENNSGLNNL